MFNEFLAFPLSIGQAVRWSLIIVVRSQRDVSAAIVALTRRPFETSLPQSMN